MLIHPDIGLFVYPTKAPVRHTVLPDVAF
jgi:hypothetical protein